MTYKITITEKPTYLHVLVTGQNSVENVERYLEEVWSECAKRSYVSVLIEARLEGQRLNVLDVFDIARKWSARGSGTMKAIAYTDANADPTLMTFAEGVTVNRDLPVAMFSTVPEAERWLLEKSQV